MPTVTFSIALSAKKQACGPEARALYGKRTGPVISDFGFFGFFSIRIPQSAIRISIDPARDFGINSSHWKQAFNGQHSARTGCCLERRE